MNMKRSHQLVKFKSAFIELNVQMYVKLNDTPWCVVFFLSYNTLIHTLNRLYLFISFKIRWMENYYLIWLRLTVEQKKWTQVNRCRYFFRYRNFGIRLKLENLKPKGRIKLDQEKTHTLRATALLQYIMVWMSWAKKKQ